MTSRRKITNTRAYERQMNVAEHGLQFSSLLTMTMDGVSLTVALKLNKYFLFQENLLFGGNFQVLLLNFKIVTFYRRK